MNRSGKDLDGLLDQMLAHHVNYFPMGWGARDWRALAEKRPDLVKRMSTRVGYRFVVTEASWTDREVRTVWRNVGVGRLPFRFSPALFLLRDGQVVKQVVDKNSDPTRWFDGEDHAVSFAVEFPKDKVQIAVALVDSDGNPRVSLGIEGEDPQRRHMIGGR
jgi:hypothetical protein